MTFLFTRRRLFHAAASGISLDAAGASRLWAATPDDWSAYQERFVASDGRVIDNGNGMQSHTEGQGYGMLFAQAFDDQDMFDRLFTWTEHTLKRPDDALHAWHFLPDASPHVPDQNNATDGDLLIALALTLGARRWQRQDLLDAARAIYAALRKSIVVKVGNRLVLLPGLYGFSWPDHVVVNLSYYIMPSLIAASEIDDTNIWRRVIHDGVNLIHQGRFGRWNLPPDWLVVPKNGDVLSIASNYPPRFSYDAVRVPLYMRWAGLLDPNLKVAFQRYWNGWGEGTMPAWVDLRSGDRSPYGAPPGFFAVGMASGLISPSDAMPFPTVAANSNYYSASLTLLASLVQDGFAADIMEEQTPP